ncbi:MAG: respiratory nitrate reductase subunit gamma [Acidobacteriota bacterium]
MVIYIIAYAGLAVFLLGVAVRLSLWLRMPIHVRWELYPVAHEGARAAYGGSYLEETDWWTKPRHVSWWGELKVMVPEILLLVALRENNRPLWFRSFPFHFGLYLVSATSVVLLANGALSVSGVGDPLGSPGALLACTVAGTLGLILALFGAIGLFLRRRSLPELREYSTAADYFNLAAFVVTFGFALAGVLLSGVGFFASLKEFAAGLFRLDLGAGGGSGPLLLPAISIVSMGALLAYIPWTHMSHFIGKYFAYHAVRWNDTPNLPGGPQEASIRQALSWNVSWAAPHIRGGGTKSWATVATEMPEEGKKP